MTEFGKKKCKKQPLRGKRASQKKGRNKGAQKKQPLKKKGTTEKNTQGRCLGLKKGTLESNMPIYYSYFLSKKFGGGKKNPLISLNPTFFQIFILKVSFPRKKIRQLCLQLRKEKTSINHVFNHLDKSNYTFRICFFIVLNRRF